jgi:nucleotide-binding universal stress UspA family protein
MSRPILVGYDPVSCDRAPVDFGAAVARVTGTRLIVACVSRRERAGAEDEPLSADEAAAALDAICEDLEAETVAADCIELHSMSAARALHEEAGRDYAGLLIVGSSLRREPARILGGSTAERLMQGAPCPVVVVPVNWGPTGRIETIGAAYVPSADGQEALRGAHLLARRFGARLRVLTVVEETVGHALETEPFRPPVPGKGRETVEGEHEVLARQRARQALERLGDHVPADVEAFVGDPADVLVDVSQHLDLLVCGSRGYGPLRAVLLGGVSRQLVARAHCPVLALTRGVEAALEALLAEAPAAA